MTPTLYRLVSWKYKNIGQLNGEITFSLTQNKLDSVASVYKVAHMTLFIREVVVVVFVW